MMRFSSVKVSKYLCLLTLLILLVDIGGGFGIKYVAISLLLIWAAALIVIYGLHKKLLIEMGIITTCVAASMLYAVIRGVNINDVISESSYVIFVVFFVVIQKVPRAEVSELFIKVIVAGSLLIIFTFILIYTVPSSVELFGNLGKTYRLGYLGIKEIGGYLFPNVYYRWSMWLIPAFVLSIGRYNVATLIIGIACLITLSTSIIFFSLLGIAILFFAAARPAKLIKISIRNILTLAIILSLPPIIFSDIIGELISHVTYNFSSTSQSTSIKLGHIDGVFDALQVSWVNLLFGMGVGSEFYSPGVGRFVINVEVSQFNFIRQYGLILSLLFFGYVLYMVACAYQTDQLGKRWAIGLLMLFFSAGTNPLLMSPVFIIVLMIVNAYVFNFRLEKVCQKSNTHYSYGSAKF